MYVVCVEFEIKPGSVADFRAAMLEQARNSLEREPGCRYFDVAEARDSRPVFFLYELYDTEAAFKLHLDSQHFRDFDARVKPWIERKSVSIFDRIYATPAS